MGLLSKSCLPLALIVGFSFMSPDLADAASSPRSTVSTCKHKRRAKRRRKVRRRRRRGARRAAARKVTARTIARWQRHKLKEDAIVARAVKAGYTVDSKKERRRLIRHRVRRSLIAKLEAASKNETPVVAEKKAPDFHLHDAIDPNDIDFDSVPPPSGIPAEYASNDQPEEKKLDTSLRPSAFDPTSKPLAKDQPETKKKRVVFAAGQ